MSIVVLVLILVGATYYFGFTDDGRKRVKTWIRDYQTYYLSKEQIFGGLDGFRPSQKIFAVNGKTGIAIDEQSRSICLLNNPSGTFPTDVRRVQRLIIGYRDLLEVSVLEDGVSMTRTSRTSQIGGALLGGVLLGGLGVVAGAFTGAKRTSNRIQTLEVRLTINSTQIPYIAIAFIALETTKNSPTYQKAIHEANRLHSLIKVLIKQADDEDRLQEEREKRVLPPQGNQALLENAKQGDEGAIAALINRSLKPKGITARARIKGNTLQIAVASDQVPPQEGLVSFLHRGTMGLQIASVENLEITAYQLGSSEPSWSQKLHV